MPIASISIKDVFRKGWELTKENLWFFIGYQIILYALMGVFSSYNEGFAASLWQLLGWVMMIIVKMGLYNSSLLIAKGVKPTFDQLYKNWDLFIPWVVASFLMAIMFFIGLLLFIVPAGYVIARYGLFPFFILDKKLGPVEALKAAAQASEGVRWPLFLVFLACAGLDILGLMLFGVGLLITVPVTLIALATVYLELTSEDAKEISINPIP